MAEKDPKLALTPKGQTSFPHLFEKEKFEDGEPKFNVTFLFPNDTDLTKLKKALKAAKEEKWGTKKVKGLKTPFKNGDAVDDEGEPKYPQDGYAGHTILKCTSKHEVGVVNKNKDPITDTDPQSDNSVYGGCYGRAYVRAFAYDHKMSRGVGFALIHYQKLEEGKRFGSPRISANDAFDDELSGESETSAFDDDGDKDPFGVE